MGVSVGLEVGLDVGIGVGDVNGANDSSAALAVGVNVRFAAGLGVGAPLAALIMVAQGREWSATPKSQERSMPEVQGLRRDRAPVSKSREDLRSHKCHALNLVEGAQSGHQPYSC